MYSNMQIKNHTHSVRQCLLMLENTQILLEYSNISLSELFAGLSENDNYNLLRFLGEINCRLENGLSFSSAYSETLKIHKNVKYLDKDDIDNLMGFFSQLGKSGIDGQIQNCCLYKEFFRQKLAVTESQEKSKCKSSAVIAMGFGTMISILLI